MKELESWSVEKSSELFGIENWGDEYFHVNQEGNISITPKGKNGPSLDLFNLVQEAKDKGSKLPILFRFNDILRHRVEVLHSAFTSAIKEHNYSGKYFPAFPIKVNQQSKVVQVLRKSGTSCSMGLEVGSKPELIAVLGIPSTPESLLLCNGYKDREYVELALTSQKVGRRVVIIVEKYSELELILKISEELKIEPEIGLRLRGSARGSGRWEKSSGEKAKFGLSISEILKASQKLISIKKESCLKLLHFHIGSQLTAISSLRFGLKEASQVYVQLKKTCTNLEFLDVGGGLGVDYDGSKTSFESSMNYSVAEYARDIIWLVGETCQQAKVPAPNIITESGRALSAHHSLLVFNVLGMSSSLQKECNPENVIEKTKQTQVVNLAQLLLSVNTKNCHESLHDAMLIRNDYLSRFNLGHLSIEDRALADSCFWALLNKISRLSSQLNYIPEDLEKLPSMLTDTYFCNMSIFQSMPDSWAIGQIFPITPIHRLDERPTNPVVLADITCDSDGQIDKFADLKDVKRYLMAHNLNNKPYYFAAFLLGAYQEILGDLHNLFGDTNAVHVDLDKEGQAELTSFLEGDSVEQVLKYVDYKKEDLLDNWQQAVENAVNLGKLKASESETLNKKYASSFKSYTYLDDK